jgi:16S rRNA (cytidine1402-2'-O)-methyltransferase
MGELYIVGTPIGNLGDITARALETLRAVDSIACEDTRHTLKLLSHFEIRKPLLSCHANDEGRAALRIVALLDEGKNIAYCTDAGTPGLSDPGAALVREARNAGHRVIPIPGPSAFSTLVSVSGFGGRGITFDGFLSPKSGRRKSRLQTLLSREEAFLLYESPYRIAKLVALIAELAPGRQLCIGRELTKLHEEIVTGPASSLALRFASNREGKAGAKAKAAPAVSDETDEGLIVEKGEFALIVAGSGGDEPEGAEE